MGFLLDMFQGFGVGMEVAAQRQQAEADNLARQWNATIARQNADLARVQAENARQRGDLEAGLRRQEADKLRGQQRAAYGASGVDANWGSAAAVQADTVAWGEFAAQEELYSYGMEAWEAEHNATMQEYEAMRLEAGIGDPNLSGIATAITGTTDIFKKYGSVSSLNKAWSLGGLLG